jgi:hypothetical protein
VLACAAALARSPKLDGRVELVICATLDSCGTASGQTYIALVARSCPNSSASQSSGSRPRSQRCRCLAGARPRASYSPKPRLDACTLAASSWADPEVSDEARRAAGSRTSDTLEEAAATPETTASGRMRLRARTRSAARSPPRAPCRQPIAPRSQRSPYGRPLPELGRAEASRRCGSGPNASPLERTGATLGNLSGGERVARGEGSGAVGTRRECVYERDAANAVTLFV